MKNVISLFFTLITLSIYPLVAQTPQVYAEGSDTTRAVIHATNTGNSRSGIEFLRGNAFNSTDWQILNDGGVFRIFDGINNFSTEGDENLNISTSGTVNLPSGTEASIGSAGGVLVLGDPNAQNLALDQNEILSRDGTRGGDLFIQPGADAGNTYLNIAGGNVGVGDLVAPVRLSIANGTDATQSGGGFLLIGNQNSMNLVLDDNEIMARDGGSGSNLFFQVGNTGNVSIGASDTQADTKLTVQDVSFQTKMLNSNETNNTWYLGASNNGWSAGSGKLIINDNSSSVNPVMMLDRTTNNVHIGGQLNMEGSRITDVADPVNNGDAVPLGYLQTLASASLFPREVSDESSTLMDFADCASYCRNLSEGGHTDWGIPSAEQLSFFTGATGDGSTLWTATPAFARSSYGHDQHDGGLFDCCSPTIDGTDYDHKILIRLHTGQNESANYNDDSHRCRCVR